MYTSKTRHNSDIGEYIPLCSRLYLKNIQQNFNSERFGESFQARQKKLTDIFIIIN
jgi:hypothetical protein